MKAVIYHATVDFRKFQPESKDFPDDIYEQLFAGARKNLAYFNIPLVHLTIKGHPGWGDENIYFDGDPQNVVYNRELFFAEYLKTQADDQVFWLTEPDARYRKTKGRTPHFNTWCYWLLAFSSQPRAALLCPGSVCWH